MKRLLLLCCLLAVACHDKECHNVDTTCGVVNPVENLGWLKQKIDRMKAEKSDLLKYYYVQQSTYKGETVFIFGNCCPFCASLFLVYDCNGNTVDIQANEVEGPTTVIWKADDSVCVTL